MMIKKNLVISAITDESEHLGWLGPVERNFDLMLVYCVQGSREDVFRNSCDYFVKTSGMFKLENISFALDTFKDCVKDYSAIWIPDDDIRTDSLTINRMFEQFNSSKYLLAHPSLIWWRGQVNYEILIQRKECLIRETNFVEMMAPIFKTEVLLSKPIRDSLLATRSGWGCDLIWAKILNYKNIAVLDEVAVTHKPNYGVRLRLGNYYNSLKKNGVNWESEYSKVRDEYGVDLKDIQVLKVYKRKLVPYIFHLLLSKLKIRFGKIVRVMYSIFLRLFKHLIKS